MVYYVRIIFSIVALIVFKSVDTLKCVRVGCFAVYCGKCGAYNNEKNQFCVNCGELVANSPKNNKLEDTAPSGTQAHASEITHVSFARKNPKLKLKSRDDSLPATQYSQPRTKPSSQSIANRQGRFKEGFIFADRYRIEKMLGSGGMGEVYKVYDINLGEIRALKVLHPSLMQKSELKQRFENEAKIISEVMHINLTRAISFGEFENNPYILMEYIDGITLRRWIHDRVQRADIDEVFDIVIQVCQGLQEAHKNTIHRDIKPDNIMLSKTGAVKIMDFGIAKSRCVQSVTKTTSSMGTAYYMAPEQTMDAAEVDERADIFSVGVIFYEMLFYKVPMGHFKIPISKERFISQRLAQILCKALESEVKDRYQSVAALLYDLENERLMVRNQRLESKVLSFSKENMTTTDKVKASLTLLVSLVLMIAVFGGASYGVYAWYQSLNEVPERMDPSLMLDVQANNQELDSRFQKPLQVVSKNLGMSFNFIPSGSFEMGDTFKEGDDDELPVREVQVDSFYMGQYEVINRQYQVFVRESGYREPVNVFGVDSEYTLWTKDHVPEEILDVPVVNVSWEDAIAFCHWLCEYENVPYDTYRLPTEAEWEKAAKGGNNYKYPWGNQAPQFKLANYGKEWIGAFTLKKVGSYAPNAYGLYDMAGNVWEWCQDVYHDDYYDWGVTVNPVAGGTWDRRVLRGGDWGDYPSLLRTSNRYYNSQNVRYYYNGFRVVRDL